MRTTVEITASQHEALSAIARRRGLRGFSVLVQEALAGYLQDLDTDEVDLLLGLEGVLSEDEARTVGAHVDQSRELWRAS
jgi:hypothetical protein